MSLDKRAIEKAVIDGTNQNILCYDSSDKTGTLTSLLLHIMTSVMTHMYQDELCFVYSPFDLPPADPQWTDKRPFYDVEIHAGPEHDYTEYFLKQPGDSPPCLASNDKYLVVGIGKAGSVILGSF